MEKLSECSFQLLEVRVPTCTSSQHSLPKLKVLELLDLLPIMAICITGKEGKSNGFNIQVGICSRYH